VEFCLRWIPQGKDEVPLMAGPPVSEVRGPSDHGCRLCKGFIKGAFFEFIFPFARFKTFAFQANSFSMFRILNIEYRIRNFEQQKFLKGIRQYSSLRYSPVPCSAVLRFKINDFQS